MKAKVLTLFNELLGVISALPAYPAYPAYRQAGGRQVDFCGEGFIFAAEERGSLL